jgi:AmmeMemoRadiSam system protein A
MNKTFSEEDKKYLTQLAKNSVESFVKTGKKINVSDVSENLKQNLACFVTIYKNGELRGCIGTIEPYDLLCESVIENAISAATRDMRFNPIEEDELKDLTYEVSILTCPEEIEFTSKEELFKKIREKGVTIEKGYNRSTYLPQVWEHFISEADFLSSLCRKAGLGGSEWKNLEKSGIRFSVYDTYK